MSDRYRFIRLLGSGGMAEVYLATAQGAEGFEKPVAIKRVLAHLSRDEDIARMFIAEAQLSMHLHHQNVVQVLDVARGPQGLFLVMELVNGWDLDVVLRSSPKHDRPLPEPLAAFILAHVVAGLSYAYRQQVNGKNVLTAHRDVSPSNVLLTVEGEVKLADFGIARAETAHRATEPGTFKGKVAYAAPEALRGEPVTQLSDQFSLGVVFHEMLVGRLPFGPAENMVRYFEALTKGPPPTLEGISPELAAVVGKMLSLDPTQRFNAIEEVGEALGRFLSRCGEPVSATELARFLGSVALPPPPQELLRQALQTQRPVQLTQVSSRNQAAVTHMDQTAYAGSAMMDDNPEWSPSGAVMDEAGRIEGAPQATPAKSPTVAGAPSWAQEMSLETLQRTPPQGTLLDHAPAEPPPSAFRRPRSGALTWLLVLGVVGGLAAVAVYVPAARGWVQPYLERAELLWTRAKSGTLVARATPVLKIDSEPPGAAVEIEGQVVGTTPLFQENNYAPGTVRVNLTLRSYRPWTGTFEGGKDVSVEAKLHR